MLELAKQPRLTKFTVNFAADDTIFLEGDDSQDLYILVEGQLELLKGDKKISEINKPGTLFGEMSFLLRGKRTATVKTRSDVKAVRIPSEQVNTFLDEFPTIAPEITKNLAQRLLETTNICYGLKEICDQFPDAVIITDKDQQIIAWNLAAEKLYGRSWNTMRRRCIDEIYENQAAFQQFLTEVQNSTSVRERPLKILHPLDNWRFVSTSSTTLYDAQQEVQGYLFLGRDVTPIQSLEKKHKQVKNWLIPALVLIGLLTSILLFSYPEFSRGRQLFNNRKQTFASKLAGNYKDLGLPITAALASGDLGATTALMQEYFIRQDPGLLGVTGLVLLDRKKNVINAFSLAAGSDQSNLFGSSYSDIDFMGDNLSAHRTLILSRPTPQHPKGERQVELAFALNNNDNLWGWILFQLDMDLIEKEYGITFKTLKKLRIQNQ